jgi:hypothetical protein
MHSARSVDHREKGLHIPSCGLITITRHPAEQELKHWFVDKLEVIGIESIIATLSLRARSDFINYHKPFGIASIICFGPPKYRYQIMAGEIADEVNNCIRAFSEQLKCEIVELNVRIDHVHILVMVPPKKSISDYVGTVIRFNK